MLKEREYTQIEGKDLFVFDFYVYGFSHDTKHNYIYRQETEALEGMNNLPRVTQLINEEV